MPLRMLMLLRDKYPQFRVDLTVLFGKEMAGRGHEMHWLMHSDPPLEKPLETTWEGGQVRVAPRRAGRGWLDRLRNNISALACDLRVFGMARRGGYDLVQSRDGYLAALMALAAARLAGCRFVYWMSFPLTDAWMQRVTDGTAPYPLVYKWRSRLFAWLLYGVILPRADLVFVQSERMKRDVMARGLPAELLVPVPMGVDLGDFPKPAPAQEQADTVCYLGTLSGVRGMDFLLHAFALLAKRRPGARLVLVGKGEEDYDVPFLEQEAKDLGIAGQVEFTGFLPRAQALERVMASAVCVSPFKPSPVLDSTSPTKLVEYLALGRPVVANDHPDQSLVLGESGAGKITQWDTAAFAAAMDELLALSPDQRAAMGAQGRSWVERNRSYAIIADKLERRYLDLCGKV